MHMHTYMLRHLLWLCSRRLCSALLTRQATPSTYLGYATYQASNTFYIVKSGTVAVLNDTKEIAQLKVRYAIITSSWMQACTAYESLYARAKCRLDNSSESARF